MQNTAAGRPSLLNYPTAQTFPSFATHPPPLTPQHVSSIPKHVGKLRCDATTWTKERKERDSHITTGKHSARCIQRLQRALWTEPLIKRHLCELAAALEYDSPVPCPSSANVQKGGAAAASNYENNHPQVAEEDLITTGPAMDPRLDLNNIAQDIATARPLSRMLITGAEAPSSSTQSTASSGASSSSGSPCDGLTHSPCLLYYPSTPDASPNDPLAVVAAQLSAISYTSDLGVPCTGDCGSLESTYEAAATTFLSSMGAGADSVVFFKGASTGIRGFVVLAPGTPSSNIFVVFKGTDTNNPGDVKIDETADLVPAQLGNGAAVNVHQGFFDGMQDVLATVVSAIQKLDPAGTAQLFITGWDQCLYARLQCTIVGTLEGAIPCDLPINAFSTCWL